MKCSTKSKIVGAILFLTFMAASPSVQAQTGAMQRILQLNVDGAYLGVHMEDVTSSNMSKYELRTEAGVIVRSVVQGSPAEAAKIQTDDVILEFAGFQVWSSAQLTRLVQETPPGRNVELGISRDGKRMKLTAQLGKREGERANPLVQILPRWLPEDRNFPFRTPIPPGDSLAVPVNRRVRLGITVQPITDQLADFFGVPGKKGVLVTSVSEGSPSSGKLRSGDVVISADGKDIENPEDLIQFVQNRAEGDINLKIIRAKKEATVVIHLPADERSGFRL